MSLNTSLAEGQMPGYAMPQPRRYPQNPPSAAPTYTKSYPTASSYTGSGKAEGLTGPTSSYPLASSTTGYTQGYNQPYSSGRAYTGSTSTAPHQYTGSTSTAPQQYTGSTSTAPQQYTGSTSTAPQQYTGSQHYVDSANSAPQRQYMGGSVSTEVPYNTGSTSQYPAPAPEHTSSVSSYPAATSSSTKPRETLPSTTSYAPSSASAMNNNTTTTSKVLQSQKSTFSKTAARSHASLATPAGRLVQRGPPPRFRPWMIILVTMFVGFLFIGIVLTVVAHWPGYTSIGADPLEIVGPVLLAVGGAGIILCVVLSIIHTRQEKEQFMKRIAASQRSIYNSRMTMQQSNYSIPAMDSQSAMLRHPSTSTYGAAMGEGDSGHPSTQTYNSTNMSYEPDSDASEQGAGKYEVYKIDTLPDPNAAGVVTSSSTAPMMAGQDNVPQPVRQRTRDTKKRTKADPSKYPAAGISSDPSYQPASSSAGRTSPMAGSGALGIAGAGSPMSGAPDLGGTSSSRRQMHDYSGEGFDVYDPEGNSRPEKPKKKSRKPKREAEAVQASSNVSGSGYPEAYQDPQRPQEPLRIAIRAQPGAQVSITPGFSSYGQETHHDSAETEI